MRKLYAVLAGVFFLAGISLLLWPSYNAVRADHTEAREIARFQEYHIPKAVQEQQEQNDTPDSRADEAEPFLPDFRAACERYNASLYDATDLSYGNYISVNPGDFGWNEPVFGVLSLPSLGSDLPLYLGTTSQNLMLGVAVLGQTSIPIGGPSTHSVICGHRTWRGDDKLLDIDKMVLGDEVIITNPWESLHYTVIDIQIIEPMNFDPLRIQANRDLISIVTCHPVNVASHRYVVTCERSDK